jgi:predicted YcjX-like family ATPase
VATKADHVPELQRDNLRSLLRAMSQSARDNAPLNGDAVSYHVVASVLSTRDGWIDHDDRPREAVVWGRRMGDAKDRAYQTGSIPMGRPPEGFWSGRYFELPIFTPPAIDTSGALGIRQFGIDNVMAELIGDQL